MMFKKSLIYTLILSLTLSACNGGGRPSEEVSSVNKATPPRSIQNESGDVQIRARSFFKQDVLTDGDLLWYESSVQNSRIIMLDDKNGLRELLNERIPEEMYTNKGELAKYLTERQSKFKRLSNILPDNLVAFKYDAINSVFTWVAFTSNKDWAEFSFELNAKGTDVKVLQRGDTGTVVSSPEKRSIYYRESLVSGSSEINVALLPDDILNEDGETQELLLKQVYISRSNYFAPDLKSASEVPNDAIAQPMVVYATGANQFKGVFQLTMEQVATIKKLYPQAVFVPNDDVVIKEPFFDRLKKNPGVIAATFFAAVSVISGSIMAFRNSRALKGIPKLLGDSAEHIKLKNLAEFDLGSGVTGAKLKEGKALQNFRAKMEEIDNLNPFNLSRENVVIQVPPNELATVPGYLMTTEKFNEYKSAGYLNGLETDLTKYTKHGDGYYFIRSNIERLSLNLNDAKFKLEDEFLTFNMPKEFDVTSTKQVLKLKYGQSLEEAVNGKLIEKKLFEFKEVGNSIELGVPAETYVIQNPNTAQTSIIRELNSRTNLFNEYIQPGSLQVQDGSISLRLKNGMTITEFNQRLNQIVARDADTLKIVTKGRFSLGNTVSTLILGGAAGGVMYYMSKKYEIFSGGCGGYTCEEIKIKGNENKAPSAPTNLVEYVSDAAVPYKVPFYVNGQLKYFRVVHIFDDGYTCQSFEAKTGTPKKGGVYAQKNDKNYMILDVNNTMCKPGDTHPTTEFVE